ncbi:MAG: hypothetical protein E7632_06830 [Ruminococcaceae bacterium]|nr:hypothetical protein [Oscillospiraceae bacterium]
MKKIIVVFLAALMLILAACGENVYTSRLFEFSVIVPDEWTANEDDYSAWFTSPEEENDDFYENVAYDGGVPLVLIEGGTADAYAEMLTEVLAENNEDFTVISRESAKIAGMDAIVLTYTCTSAQTAYVIKQRMYILTDGESVFNLVYTATEASFDRFASEAAAIAESFKVRY